MARSAVTPPPGPPAPDRHGFLARQLRLQDFLPRRLTRRLDGKTADALRAQSGTLRRIERPEHDPRHGTALDHRIDQLRVVGRVAPREPLRIASVGEAADREI